MKMFVRCQRIPCIDDDVPVKILEKLPVGIRHKMNGQFKPSGVDESSVAFLAQLTVQKTPS
jgi:hypothetical protein